jgi:RNA polymerase sigma-70 factor (ECF subfamily)
MAGNASGDRHDTARRFREAALPHLDDVYTLARYLLREPADAEDAVQECYLRALRHFDTFRGPEMKPWLFAILRNICRGEFVRRSRAALTIVVWSRRCRSHTGRRSCCARSTNCRIARSPMSSASPSAP